ncbi:MAG: hypothetical protein ACRDP3_28490, partial [Streptomyces sp.]|uniref:hypothetical protein n=1 Tax=Streptomyces sp. TaxID=1931 RepID=UPI003D6A61F3
MGRPRVALAGDEKDGFAPAGERRAQAVLFVPHDARPTPPGRGAGHLRRALASSVSRGGGGG